MNKYTGLDGILLIDDDHPINFIHRKVIQKAGVDAPVEAITNVQDALEFLTYSGKYEGTETLPRPGLIFLDINMPGLNGWDFLEAYHLLPERLKARVVIVMLTTSLNPDDREKALKDRVVDDFLIKPLRPEILTEILKRYFSPEKTDAQHDE